MKTYRVSDILHLERRPVSVDPLAVYQEIGVRSFGRGIFHKEPILGADLGNKRVFEIWPGDLVSNNVFAWEGAVALAGPMERGKIGSHRFMTYVADPTVAEVRYLRYFFLSEVGLALLGQASPGSAGRNRTLAIDRFAELLIPLPTPPEQRRIAALLDSVLVGVRSAGEATKATKLRARALRQALIDDTMKALPVRSRTLSSLLEEPPRNGWSPKGTSHEEGTPVLTLGAVTGFRYDARAVKYTTEPVDQAAHYWLRPGDLLVTRSNTPDLVGHAAVYTGDPSPCVYPDLMIRRRLSSLMSDGRFVLYWLQTSLVRGFMRSRAKGSSMTMVKISQKDVEDIPFPEIQLDDQMQLATQLDRLTMLLDAAETRIARREIVLSSLTPSVLNQAFAGDQGK